MALCESARKRAQRLGIPSSDFWAHGLHRSRRTVVFVRCHLSFSLLAAFGVAVFGACGSAATGGGSPSSGNDAGSDGSSSGGQYDAGGMASSNGGGTPVCPAPMSNGGATLPFAVDTPKTFIPSGYEGDFTAIRASLDTTCGGNRSSSSALGNCHTFTYVLTRDAGLGAGWAGVVWQYPTNNCGAQPGYAIPPGASQVTFYVRGATGRESVSFGVGGIGYGNPPSISSPCVDTINATMPKMALPTAWTKVTISIAGQSYAGGVLNGFAWVAGAGDQPSGASEVTFYIDDIEWTL